VDARKNFNRVGGQIDSITIVDFDPGNFHQSEPGFRKFAFFSRLRDLLSFAASAVQPLRRRLKN